MFRLTPISLFLFLCAGSILIGSEPAAEWTFQGREPLRDIRGGLAATLGESNPEGTVSITDREVTFVPQEREGELFGGTLEVPWDVLVSSFNKGFSIAFTMTYSTLDRSENGKDLGILDTAGRQPGPFRFGVNQGPNGEKYYVRLTTDPTGDPTLTLVSDRQPSEIGQPIDVLISVRESDNDRYEIELFLNGKMVQRSEGEVFPLFDMTDLVLGSYVERGRRENFFDGTISNLRIYPTPSSNKEE